MMLRTALPLTRRAVLRPSSRSTRCQSFVVRYYADKPSIQDPRPPVFPGSASTTQTTTVPVAPGSVNPGQPMPVPAQTSPASIPPAPIDITSPSTPPPNSNSTADAVKLPVKPPRKSRRFRNFLLSLIILGGLGFGGGVWYSSVSDNFHDFFTEYVPFGEEAVAYFEEREFRKRFPSRKFESTQLPDNREERVTIPSKSGLSWRLSGEDGKDSDIPKSAISAVNAGKPGRSPSDAQRTPSTATAAEKSGAVDQAKAEASNKGKSTSALMPASEPVSKPLSSKPETKSTSTSVQTDAPASSGGRASPDVNEPSVYVPVDRIDPLTIKHADEPLVQDLVKILNDIILVANADNATGKFNGAMAKAKAQLENVGQRILDLKAAERKAAEETTKASEAEFDKAAKELVRRLETEMNNQEGRWRDEFKSERSRWHASYEERLKSETDHASKLAEEKLQNSLLEQAISLKKDFASSVRKHVEEERNGRLAKLTELSTSVDELQNLTGEWNKVLEANLSTQHLLNAVEAVKTSLETADRPRPFVRELAALSEIANNNEVVDAALGSISPSAYTYGIPTSAQLVERYRRVADEVRKAALLPENAGMASHATSYVLSKVMFKKEGSVQGTDVESSLLRAEMLLEEGRLDDAAREVNTLTGWAKTLSKDWLTEVRRVLEVRQALQVVEMEARLQSLKVD